MNTAIQENRSKVIQQQYLTPKLLAKMNPLLGDGCWRCGKGEADLFNMWWGCPKVTLLWKEVGLALSHIIGEVPLNPRLMLLLDFHYYKLQNYRILFGNSLTAVTMLIAKTWKMQETLKLSDWIDKMRLMRKVSALSKYRMGVKQALRDFVCQWALLLIPNTLRDYHLGESLLTVL